MSRPISSLAKLASSLASPEMERPTYWRQLVGGDRWAVLLLTQGKPGESPGTLHEQPPVRLSPRWLRRTGADLAPEDLLHERIGQYLRAAVHDGEVDVARAASIATHAAVKALAELGVDVATLTPTSAPEERGG
jgi:hypothetical protein